MQHLLFICSRNQWRSRTAETLFQDHPDVRVKSAGTSSVARVRVSQQLLDWADRIYVMESHHRDKLLQRFGRGDWEGRTVVLDIADEYRYMDEELVGELRDVVKLQ
ncbi:hypothetical protein LEM8419_00123 [Neolewinella maritima]|uniref:Protein-tyrosine-phosphatase n=1 Tax=Neolewinella maritima TaxID=1383882 RepID=A0ABM9AVV8_9BACT|nr:protein tyrosine phosphatase [Neolewinella maritima]CAH0998786.1 hypothetical protein LEM8419_00123 [Neolewinella maritima]